MSKGTEWNYNRQVVIKKYESESSEKIIGIDTFNYSIDVWIIKDTILNDTMQVTLFKSREESCNCIKTTFKYIDQEGLKTYAYINGGTTPMLANNKYPLQQFVDYKNHGFEKSNSLTNSNIIYESVPTLNLKLPLTKNSQWTYRLPTETRELQIDKKVIDDEYINVNGENFHCLKLEYIYLNDSLFNNFEVTEWISDIGIIKSVVAYNKNTLRSIDGTTWGTHQMTETISLVSIAIE